MHFTILVPFLQVTVTVQTRLVIVLAWEEGQHFVACQDSDPAWPHPNYGAKDWHWYARLVVPRSCAQQALLGTTAALEDAA